MFLLSGAAQDTVFFVYNYAIFPAILVAVCAVIVVTVYWVYMRRKAALIDEEEALYELIDKITGTLIQMLKKGCIVKYEMIFERKS